MRNKVSRCKAYSTVRTADCVPEWVPDAQRVQVLQCFRLPCPAPQIDVPEYHGVRAQLGRVAEHYRASSILPAVALGVGLGGGGGELAKKEQHLNTRMRV